MVFWHHLEGRLCKWIARYDSLRPSVDEPKPLPVTHNAACKIFIFNRLAELAIKGELNLYSSTTPCTETQSLLLVTTTILQLMLTFCWEECRAKQDQSALLALPLAWTNAGYFSDMSRIGKTFPEYMLAPAKPCLGHFRDSIVLGTEGFFNENSWFLRKLLRKPCHNLYSMFTDIIPQHNSNLY